MWGLPLAQDQLRRAPAFAFRVYSREAAMGRELMAARTNHTARIPSAVTTNRAAKGSVSVNFRNTGNLKISSSARLFRVSGLGFRVQGFGIKVWGLGFRVWVLGFRISGSGFRVHGFG